MPTLDCISILEPGSITSDSGNVVVPTGAVPFAITAYLAFSMDGTGTAEFLSAGAARFASIGDSVASFIAFASSTGTMSCSGLGTATFIGSGASDDDDFLLLLL